MWKIITNQPEKWVESPERRVKMFRLPPLRRCSFWGPKMCRKKSMCCRPKLFSLIFWINSTALFTVPLHNLKIQNQYAKNSACVAHELVKVNDFDYLRGSQGLLLFKIISKILNKICCKMPTKIMHFILLVPTGNDWKYILTWAKTQKLSLQNRIRFLLALSVFFGTHIHNVFALNEINFFKTSNASQTEL